MSSGWELKIREYRKTDKETKTERERERYPEKIAFSHLPELDSCRGSRSLFSLQ